MTEDSSKLLHDIDRKISHICADIQYIKDDLKEAKKSIKAIDDKMDEKFEAQKDACFGKSTQVNKELSARPKIASMLTILFFLMTVIFGSYGYTKVISDRLETNLIMITENKKETEKLDTKIQNIKEKINHIHKEN